MSGAVCIVFEALPRDLFWKVIAMVIGPLNTCTTRDRLRSIAAICRYWRRLTVDNVDWWYYSILMQDNVPTVADVPAHYPPFSKALHKLCVISGPLPHAAVSAVCRYYSKTPPPLHVILTAAMRFVRAHCNSKQRPGTIGYTRFSWVSAALCLHAMLFGGPFVDSSLLECMLESARVLAITFQNRMYELLHGKKDENADEDGVPHYVRTETITPDLLEYHYDNVRNTLMDFLVHERCSVDDAAADFRTTRVPLFVFGSRLVEGRCLLALRTGKYALARTILLCCDWRLPAKTLLRNIGRPDDAYNEQLHRLLADAFLARGYGFDSVCSSPSHTVDTPCREPGRCWLRIIARAYCYADAQFTRHNVADSVLAALLRCDAVGTLEAVISYTADFMRLFHSRSATRTKADWDELSRARAAHERARAEHVRHLEQADVNDSELPSVKRQRPDSTQ